MLPGLSKLLKRIIPETGVLGAAALGLLITPWMLAAGVLGKSALRLLITPWMLAAGVLGAAALGSTIAAKCPPC